MSNVMILGRSRVLRQDIQFSATGGQKYQIAFWVKLENTKTVDLRIMLRMKFTNFDNKNGLCNPRKVCNFFVRPLAKKVTGTGGWQHVITDEFDFFSKFYLHIMIA